MTYRTVLPDTCKGTYRLDLGEVRHYAKVYVDGKETTTLSFAPYTALLDSLCGGETLTIVVANTR